MWLTAAIVARAGQRAVEDALRPSLTLVQQAERTASAARRAAPLAHARDWELLPGTTGRLAVLADRDAPEVVRIQAARLLARWYSPRTVYCRTHPGLAQRWEAVRSALDAHCRERAVSPSQAWWEIAAPIFFDLAARVPADLSPRQVRYWLMRELRKNVERFLLGRTVDQRSPERLLPAEPTSADLVPTDDQLGVWLALDLLDDVERWLILEHHVEGHTLAELAVSLETSVPTVHRRLRAATDRLRQLLEP